MRIITKSPKALRRLAQWKRIRKRKAELEWHDYFVICDRVPRYDSKTLVLFETIQRKRIVSDSTQFLKDGDDGFWRCEGEYKYRFKETK